MKITVTQDDIDTARRTLNVGSPFTPPRARCCAVSQAVKKMFPDCMITTGAEHIAVTSDSNLPSDLYNLPGEAQEFIRRFDRDLPVEAPFTFEAELDRNNSNS